MKQCAYCGAQVPDGLLDCPACGKSLFRRPPFAVRKPTTRAIRPKIHLIPIVVGMLCLLFGLFIAWVFGQVTIIACTRVEPSQVDCQVYHLWAGWLPAGQPTVIRQVRLATARLEVSDFYDQMDRVYVELNSTLQTKQVSWPPLPDASRAAGQINLFIRDEQSREVEVRNTMGWFEVFCGAFLFADALLFSVLAFRRAIHD